MKNFIFIFILLLLASCRVFEPDTVVEGKVWDPALNKPVAGLVVTLSEIPTNFSTRCCAEDVQTVYTDANGEYHFEPFKARMASWYEVDFDNDAWWYNKNFFYITKETTNYDSINAVARVTNYFGMINDNPSDDDTLWAKGTCLSMNWLAYGAHSDPDKYAMLIGNVQVPAKDHPGSNPSGWYLFEWKVWRKGQKTYHQDSVWVENGTVYELHY